eukprot:CAMPEP_0119006956 /NCGR_PEP_ID=MMETSP1176-20130426/2658_1 /TAXON_ID=265551 /ORGANISM="Synedropsis recta cf, Strain CCMP1620" /LENGTH=763 /DNA_ID=CAMNT_0006958993 /DNA_START=120 /DNA_END=2407 /DNA_ORIENTATION=-
MVVDYPGLRRRAPRGVERDVPPLPPPAGGAAAPNRHQVTSIRRWKASQIYCFLSLLLAILAIVTPGSNNSSNGYPNPHGNHKHMTPVMVDTTTTNNNRANSNDWFFVRYFAPRQAPPPQPTKKQKAPAWIRWALPKEEEVVVQKVKGAAWRGWIDPVLLHYPLPSSTLTDLLDKILTSTPRLLAIANLLLSITYLVHTAVANLFLDLPSLSRESWSGRERLGGFLVFKLLLISAVVAPDTLDLLILLSWYTLLSFLRSLAGLCAATTAHTSQSGQAPRPGVLTLLILVLLSDFVAASLCVALFHGAGYGMVLLLTCDCALLAVDVLSHILRHLSQTMDLAHSAHILKLEARQLALHSGRQEQQSVEQDSSARQEGGEQEEVRNEGEQKEESDGNEAPAQTGVPNLTGDGHVVSSQESRRWTEDQVTEESRQLDQRMERMEALHNRRLGILESTVFGLQLLAYTLTVAHFLHIWTLHGLQFTLIDGVLALHLHSALSAAGKKIAERRNLNRIARDLDAMFEDATEMELAKSTDIFCCICLGTMSTGSVKKVGCGHLYHTHCLREVVERARSMEAAKCPLCRASVLSGEPPEGPTSEDENGANGNNNGGGGEHALFRFSTEGILPAWLPLPAFSFEVVRRPPAETNTTNNNANNNAENNATGDAPRGAAEAPTPRAAPTAPQPSFFRRLMMLAGMVPMSPEEEASALEQLVDMFPQYDRADLLRELRARGSPEAVVEAVLVGIFAGVPRGRSGNEDTERQPTPAV